MYNMRFNRCIPRLFRSSSKHSSNSTTTSANTNTGSNNNHNAYRKSDVIGIIFFGSICLGAASLGVWQTQRYVWKTNLIEEQKRKFKEPPMTIPSDSLQYLLDETLKNCKGQRIQLKGKYLHDKEILLGPRSAPAGLFGAGAQGLASNPQGYYIITPLKRSDGTILFINRGWIPINMKEWNKPSKEIEIVAIISETEKKAAFTPENSTTSNKLLWLEASTLLEITKLKGIAEPILIFEEINTNNSVDINNNNTIEYPAARKIDFIDSHYVTPATHFVYAITWFSLAIAGLGMTYYTLKRPTRLKKINNKKTI